MMSFLAKVTQIVADISVTAASKLDIFMDTYAKKLEEAHEKHPDQYAWPKSDLPKILERMRAAVEKGSFNKDSHAFKATCKELNIPYTYAGIKQFISSEEVKAQRSPATASFLARSKLTAKKPEYDVSFALVDETKKVIKEDLSRVFCKAIESALKAQSAELADEIFSDKNYCYTEVKDQIDPDAVLNHIKKHLDISEAQGDIYLLIRETELSGDPEKDTSLRGQEDILFAKVSP
jgi:hypothetical protein